MLSPHKIASWIANDLLETVNCLLWVPVYGMLLCAALYGFGLWFAVAYGHPWVATVLVAYLAFCLVDARPTRAPGGGGGRRDWAYQMTEWGRSLSTHSLMAKWFPATLHKTAELDPSRPHLFLYHPHGVICLGANIALNSNGCRFDKAFPGVKRHGVALNLMFRSPLYREWMMFMGMISANKTTLVATLRNGRSVVLVPGGAIEALSAHKGVFRLYVKNRKGFIKVAMEANALPVPVLGFGENNAFETLLVDEHQGSNVTSSSWWSPILHSFQIRLYRLTTFSIPILTKLVPNRTPIDVVVGAPLQFKGATVDECHAEYLDALRRLYDEHKAKYGHHDIPLEIV